MTENTPQEPLETTEEPLDGQETPQEPIEAPEAAQDTPDAQEEQETFPREYVEKLRQENGKHRQRAQQADDLANRLHVQLVKETGRLADPEDLDFSDEHLDDPDALNAAIEELISRKPHLASRRPRGNIGQGQTSNSGGNVDLAAIMRSRA